MSSNEVNNSSIGEFLKANWTSKGFGIFWYFHKFDYQRVIDSSSWDSILANVEMQDIFRIRVFNEDQELHIWRSNNKLLYRIKSDEDASIQYIDSQVLINNQGTSILNYKYYVQRSYIDFINDQASIVDSRLVSIQ